MTLQELLDKCRDNINSEVVFQEIVAEHDKQIREDYAKEIALNFDEMDKTAYRMGRADGIAQGEFDGKVEIINSIDNLRQQYVDSCNMCTSTKCEDCKIDQFIEDLEQLKEQK